MASFPITSGPVTIPTPWQPIAVTVTNTSATNPASVTITASDGSTVWACQLGPRGQASFGQGVAGSDPYPAGVYTVAVSGTVVGTVTR